MFANIYQRRSHGAPVGDPVPGGWWPDKATADTMAARNESERFKRVMCLEAPTAGFQPCTAI